MKFTRFLIALGFFGLLLGSCTHHSSCPAYSDNNGDSINEGVTEVMVLEDKNV